MTGQDLTSDPGVADGANRPAAWIALAVFGLAVVMGAAWFGYRSGFDGELPPPQSTPIADPRVAAAGTPAQAPPINNGGVAVPTRQQPVQNTEPVLRWPLWDFQLGQPIPPRDPPLTPPGWRLLGATMSREGWKVAILRQDARQPEYFGLGASLPGGYVIKAISDEDVTLSIDRRDVVLSYTGSR